MNKVELETIMAYDPETGQFTWLVNRGPAKQGQLAGGIHHSGYRYLTVGGRHVAAHRLAWFWCNGAWPDGEVDHINGVRDDNRITNLQVVDHNENAHNRGGAHKGNRSKRIGVTWHKAQAKWRARIRVDKKEIALGYFDNIEVAAKAYLEAKAIYHRNNFRLLGNKA